MMEKIRSYAFGLLIVVLGFSFAGMAHASTATVTIGSQSAINGANISVPITASNFGGAVAGMDFKVSYDHTLLTYTGFTLGSTFAGHPAPTTDSDLLIANNAYGPFALNWFDASSALSVDNGTLITLNFTVTSSATTTANLTFTGTPLDLASITGDAITSSFVPTFYVAPTVGISTNHSVEDSHSISTQTTNPTVTTTTTTSINSQKLTYNLGITTLKLGSKGDAVKELQRFLNDTMKLKIKVDGILGKNTIAIIKKWQKARGLVADGLVGTKTKAIMNGEGK